MSRHFNMQAILNKIREDFNADRLVLAKIHTGSPQGLGPYLYYFSIQHEIRKDESIKKIKPFVQYKPVSILELEHSNYESDILFTSKELEEYPLLCNNHLKRIETSTLINFYIYYHNLIIGLVSLQYISLNNCPFKNKEDCLKNKGKILNAKNLVEEYLKNR